MGVCVARLRTLAPQVGRLPPRLAVQVHEGAARDLSRDRGAPWRRWYKTARWQKLRAAVLLRDLYACRICERIEANTSRLVCDHVEPHRGDEVRFWAGPFQTLCKTCHDSRKQREEQPRGW